MKSQLPLGSILIFYAGILILNGVIIIDKCLFVNFLKYFEWLDWVACWKELSRKDMSEGLNVMIEF